MFVREAAFAHRIARDLELSSGVMLSVVVVG